jgi:hydroxylamine reductase
MAATLNAEIGADELVGLVLKCGEVNLRAMELLDAGNTGTYGHPVPTQVSLGAKKGKAILVSGHDLKDLDEILKQTEGKGVNVYTHGEMLPTHGYPELKKHAHFIGHYGTAWQNQVKEFGEFPGAILMTTNCIQKPQESYSDNIFTAGLVGWPGVQHIATKNFSPVIEKALEMPGFTQDTDGKTVMVGFGRNAVMGVAGQVIDAVKAKAIRHFFLVGGCDGAKPGRSYYTEFVEKVPEDCVVLTLACGKFRFFDKDLGDIGGIPRLLDVGQCNDAYSAIKIASALADAFECGVNDLPLSMVLSWYEQKAVAILLTLLHLGIQDIRLGPSLPAFVSPNILNVLVEKFSIKPISTPDEDLQAILG